MLVVLADTHETEALNLVGTAADAADENRRPASANQKSLISGYVADADLVLHAGDFTTEAVLDGFNDAAADVRAVHGNRDSPAVTERLPAATTLDYEGVRIAMTHQQRGGVTGLTMFGRERGADLVVSGHTHRPQVDETDGMTLLNPGSHADPRGARQSIAVLEPGPTGLSGRLETVDGEVFNRFDVENEKRP